MNEKIKTLADRAHAESYEVYLDRLSKEPAANVIFYDIFNHKFCQMIVEECAQLCMSQADRKNIRTAFGIAVESNIKYPGPDAHGSITSQYTRQYNLPGNSNERKN